MLDVSCVLCIIIYVLKRNPVLPNSHPHLLMVYPVLTNKEMPSLNVPVQRLKVATLPLDLPCSGPVTHSREILTTGKSHRKMPDSFEEASGHVRPEQVNRWPNSMTDIY
jgi:hypothetical protein